MDIKMLRTARRIMSFVLVFMMFSGMIPTSTFTQDASANHIHQQNPVGSSYNYLGPKFPIRLDDNGYCAYCQAHSKQTPGSGIVYTFQESQASNYGKTYILNHGLIKPSIWLGGSGVGEVDGWWMRYYATQISFTAYNGQVSTNWSKDPQHIGTWVKNNVAAAKACSKLSDIVDVSDVKISLKFSDTDKKASDHDLYESGDYYRTKKMYVETDGSSPTLSLSAADGNKISGVKNKMEKKGSTTGGFYYQIATSKITDVLKVKITATASKSASYWTGDLYTASNSSYQPFLIPTPNNVENKKSVSITVKLDIFNVYIYKYIDTYNSTTGVAENPKIGVGWKFNVKGKGKDINRTTKKTTDKGDSTSVARADFEKLIMGKYTIKELDVPKYYDTFYILQKITNLTKNTNWSSKGFTQGVKYELDGKPGKTYKITYWNKLKRGKIQVKKKLKDPAHLISGDILDYEALNQFTFRLTGTADCGYKYNLVATTDANGVAKFKDSSGSEDLLIGTYTITEELTDLQKRFFATPLSQTAKVTYNGNTVLNCTNTLKPGELTINKECEDGQVKNIQFYLYGTPLAATEHMAMYNKDRTKYAKEKTYADKYLADYARGKHIATTDANGVAKFVNILIGTYTIEEVYPGKSPPGEKNILYKYIKPQNQTKTLTYQNPQSADFENKLKRGNLKVKKWSEDGVLAGFRFHLYGQSLQGEWVDEVRYTDEYGVAEFNDILISGAEDCHPGGGSCTCTADCFCGDNGDGEGENSKTAGSCAADCPDCASLKCQNYYTLVEENIPSRYYSQGYVVSSNAAPISNIRRNFIQRSIQVQITAGDTYGEPHNTYTAWYNLLKRGNIKVVKRCEDDLVVGLTFRLKFKSLASEQTGKDWIPNSIIDDTTMDSIAAVPGDAYRNVANWQHRYSVFTSNSRSGLEQINGYYIRTTRVADKSGTVVRDGVRWTTATIYFKDIPISGSGEYIVEEINTPTRYIRPYAQTCRVTSTESGSQEIPLEVGLEFLNELKRGSLLIKKTSEDGFIKNMTFRLTGTCLAYYQAGWEKTRNTVGSVPYTVYHERLVDFEYIATTDKDGIARFENIPISYVKDDELNVDTPASGEDLKKEKRQYVIEEIYTKTRYIQPASQSTPIAWNDARHYKESNIDDEYSPEGSSARWKNNYTLHFYNQLKRGDLEIRKASEDGFIKNFKFRLTGICFAEKQVNGKTINYGEYNIANTLVNNDGDYNYYNPSNRRTNAVEEQTGSCVPPDISTDIVITPAMYNDKSSPYYNYLYNVLYKIDRIEKTNAQGVARFTDVPISDDYYNGTHWTYTITEVDTPRRYIVPKTQATQIYWKSNFNTNTNVKYTGKMTQWSNDGFITSTKANTYNTNFNNTYNHENYATDLQTKVLNFYNILKRGKLIIRKSSENVDKDTRKPIPETVDLSGYVFKITVKSLAEIDAANNAELYEEESAFPPAYYGRGATDDKCQLKSTELDDYGNVVPNDRVKQGYETTYYAVTDKNGVAVFEDILINDYLYIAKTETELLDKDKSKYDESKPNDYANLKRWLDMNNDVGNYYNVTTGFDPLTEGTVGLIYTYKVEEINLSTDYMQPDVQHIQIKWENDIVDDSQITLSFANLRKKFRAIIEKVDSETGEKPQGEATLIGAEYDFFYEDKNTGETVWLKKYTSALAEYWIEKDPTLADMLLPGHTYIVTDYYACGDGYYFKETKAPTGYELNEEIIYIDGKSDRLLAADRYNRLYEKTEYTIFGERAENGGARYTASEDVIKVKIRLHKMAIINDAEYPEYCIEFKVYPRNKSFKWNEDVETPKLTTEDPVLQDPYDPEFDPMNFDMTSKLVREQIEIEQARIRERVQAYAKDQDYLITDVNGVRDTVWLPYGVYKIEQVTTWKAVKAAPLFEVSLLEIAQNVQTVDILGNMPRAMPIKIVKVDSELNTFKYKDKYERAIKLAGAQFVILDAETLAPVAVKNRDNPDLPREYVITTNENGEASTDESFAPNAYYIIEVTAPDGFARAKWEKPNCPETYFQYAAKWDGSESFEEYMATYFNAYFDKKNGKYKAIQIGSDPESFDEDGGYAEWFETTFGDISGKGIIKLKKEGERLTHIGSTIENSDKIYTLNYEKVSLRGAEFDIYAVESPTAFSDIPEDMKQYAKPIVASNSKDLNYCVPRYFDGFGNRLDTSKVPVDSINTNDMDGDGYTYSKELYNGLYRVVETKAPEGMLLDKTPHYVLINNDDEDQATVDFDLVINDDRQKVKFTVEKSMNQLEKYGIGYSNEVEEVVFGLYAKEAIRATDGTYVPAGGLIDTVRMEGKNIKEALGRGTFDADVPAGKYYIREIKTHEAYILDTNKYDVTFDYFQNAEKNGSYTTDLGVTYQVDAEGYIELKPINPYSANDGTTLVNELKLGQVKGYKVSQSNRTKRLSGALFGLFKEGTTSFVLENALQFCYSDTSGYFEFNDVPYGTWILKEMKTPFGYAFTNSSTQIVNIEYNGQVISFDDKDRDMIENAPIDGDILLIKYDGATNKVITDHTSKKALFTLYEDTNGDGKHQIGEPVFGTTSGYSTDEDGRLLIKDVPYGDYVLVESASPDGYILDRGEYPVQIRDDKTYQITNTTDEIFTGAGNVFVNERKLGTLTIKKTAEALSNVVIGYDNNGNPILGQVVDVDNITFRIQCVRSPFYKNSNDAAKLIFTATTDKNGVAVFENIPIGYYRVIEMSSEHNQAYNLSSDEGVVVVNYNQNTVKEVHNIPIMNKLRIVKYAPDGGDISKIVYKITGKVNGVNDVVKYVTINQDIQQYGEFGKKSTTEVDLVIGDYTIEEIMDTNVFIETDPQVVKLNDRSMSREESEAQLANGTNDYPVTTITFTNYLKTLGNLKVIKTGESMETFVSVTYTENTAPQVALPNVSFSVVGDPNSEHEEVKNFNTVITTGSDGVAELKRLHVGRYLVTELHPNTYKLVFKAKFNDGQSISEKSFTVYLSPKTEKEAAIRAGLLENMKRIGAADSDTAINRIINMLNSMESDETIGLRPQSYITDSYEISLERVGNDGNLGYIVTEPKWVEITYNPANPYGTYELTTARFENKLETSSIEITKTAEDKEVDGVVFVVSGYTKTGISCEYILSADDITTVYDAETATNKLVARVVSKLLSGNYTVRELSKTQYNIDDLNDDGTVPDGLEKEEVELSSPDSIYVEPDEQTLNLAYDYFNNNAVSKLNVHNVLKRGNLRIVKAAEQRDDGDLQGFRFMVSGVLANGQPYGPEYFYTDSNGEIFLNDLVVGRYTVQELREDEYGNELAVMYAYELAEPELVDVVANETVEVDIVNYLERGPLEIIKTSVDGKVEGIEFEVKGKQKNGIEFCGRYITDANGRIYEDIPAGEYVVTEILPENTPYKKQASISITVDKYGYTTSSSDPDDEAATSTDATPATPTDPTEEGNGSDNGSDDDNDNVIRIAKFHNTFAYGSVMVTKSSEDGKVEGFEFELYGFAFNGEEVHMIVTTDAFGQAIFTDVPVGIYTVTERETEVSMPYVLPSSQKVLVLEDKYYINLDFYNELKRGSLEILKVGSDGYRLANAEFVLYNEDKTVYGRFKTNDDGIGVMSNIPYGVYYLRETKAPSGYDINNNVYRVDIDAQGCVKRFTIIDRKTGILPPYTGDWDLIVKPTDTTTSNTPASVPVTGDTTDYTMIGLTMLLSAFVAFFSKKKREEA